MAKGYQQCIIKVPQLKQNRQTKPDMLEYRIAYFKAQLFFKWDKEISRGLNTKISSILAQLVSTNYIKVPIKQRMLQNMQLATIFILKAHALYSF